MTKPELFDLLWEINYLATQIAQADSCFAVDELLNKVEATTYEIYRKFDEKEN